jgi:hypothetical protein
MIETNLQHITPRLSASDIVEQAQRAEETRILESLRKHMCSEWERAEEARVLRVLKVMLCVGVAVALAVIAILAWR